MMGGYVKTYAPDVNASCIPEEGAQSPSWAKGLIIIIIIIIFSASCLFELACGAAAAGEAVAGGP
jgi:hypothetical protein